MEQFGLLRLKVDKRVSKINIDIKVLSKFYAFKDYAEKNKINWGFVRPMNGELYLNNTEYTKNIEDSRWVNLNNFF